MNLAVISVLLQELLFENERITLPGVGTFILEEIPATFLEDSNIMLPPTKKIVFDNTQVKNDGLLENAYARKTGLILEDSKRDLLFLSKKVKEAISDNLKVVIPEFGTLYNNRGEISFEKDSDLDVAPDSFGLDAITLEPVEFDLTQTDTKLPDTVNEQVEQDMEIVQETEPQPQPQQIIEEKVENTKAVTLIMKLMIALVVILLVILICVIFKDSILEMLKQIMYSKEELEIMEKWATFK